MTDSVEHHFKESELVRDIFIRMSDRLTVTSALKVRLSGIANSTAIVVTGRLVPLAPYLLNHTTATTLSALGCRPFLTLAVRSDLKLKRELFWKGEVHGK